MCNGGQTKTKMIFSGTILFQITAAILLIEFKIKNDLICISRLENLPNETMQSITGTYYKLPKLIRVRTIKYGK